MMKTKTEETAFQLIPNLPQIRKTLKGWGWSLVPIPHRTKSPDRPWREWQDRIATDEEMETWQEHGIGVVCGAVSGNLICLDFDDREEYNLWIRENEAVAGRLPTAETSRGMHVFVRTTELAKNGRFCRKGSKTLAGDLLAHHKLAVLPPTIHPTGRSRRWTVEPMEKIPVWDFHELGIEYCAPPARPMEVHDDLELIPEGMRHSELVNTAMKLRKAGFNQTQMATLLERFNDVHCRPPLEEGEIIGIAKWVSLLEDREVRIIEKQFSDGRTGIIIDTTKDDAKRYDEAFVPGDKYMEETDEAFEWLVEGFLPTGYLVVMGGTSKAGKSCFLTALSIALANGQEFMGMNVAYKTPVLWCAFEESRGERAMTLAAHHDVPSSFLVTHCKPLIDTPDGLALLRHNIRKHEAKLIVVDPLYGANAAESLTDGKSARNALQGLKDLCNEENCTAIVIHHLTKNVGAGLVRERMADSNQILATASMDILMDSKEVADGRLLTLKCRGRGSFANQTWVVKSSSVTSYELVAHGEAEEVAKAVPKETHRDTVLELLQKEPSDAESLAAAVGLTYSGIRSMLSGLIRDGLVDVVGKKGNRKLYGTATLNCCPVLS